MKYVLLSLCLVTIIATEWQLTWSDEFSAPLNASVWKIKNNVSHCCDPFGKEELELFLTEKVYTQDGHLRLQTQWNPTKGHAHDGGVKLFNYTSASLDTSPSFSQMYGRFAANCSLPTNKAEGIWPAFWLMPESNLCWPTGGEIDIFEMNGDPIQNYIWGSYHWAKPGQCGQDQEVIPGWFVKPKNAPEDWQTGWHIYAVEWFEDRMDFYLDDMLYLTRKATEVDMPPGPMHIIFDQAVDQTIFSPQPDNPYYKGEGVSLLVDWVRVYKEVKTEEYY